jgi:hypothetical protein
LVRIQSTISHGVVITGAKLQLTEGKFDTNSARITGLLKMMRGLSNDMFGKEHNRTE